MRPARHLLSLLASATLAAAAPLTVRAQPAPPAAVAPASLEALDTMSAYLRTLQAFEVKADMRYDAITDDDVRVQLTGVNTYKVRRPNGFVIESVSDRQTRVYYYDGKTVTISAPRLGYYAQASAPPTIRETLDVLDEQYDIQVALEDLFRWGEPGDKRAGVSRGVYVGPARLGGVETDQYAYTSGPIDWQIWIERGERPLPRRIVITADDDPAHPQFTADLTWDTAPRLSAADFTFKPPADAKTITIARAPTGQD